MGIYSTPLNDLVERLNWHTANVTGRLLKGWKWELSAKGTIVPAEEVQGIKDLPSIRLLLPEITEEYRPKTLTVGTMTISLIIATAKEKGIIDWMQSVEKVMDALQQTAHSPPEVKALAGARKPFNWSTQNANITSVSMSVDVIIALENLVTTIAQRSM